MDKKTSRSKGFHMPHVFIILLLIMLLVVALSYVIPSGSYERITDETTGISVVDPDTFRYVENENPITFMNYFEASVQRVCERRHHHGDSVHQFRRHLPSGGQRGVRRRDQALS